MNTLNEIPLGSEAREYIKTRLADGNTLAQHLQQVFDLSTGRVIALLPSYVNASRASQFSTGGKLVIPPGSEQYVSAPDGSTLKITPKPNTDDYLVTKIQDFLREKEAHICILEDALSRPADPYLSSIRTRFATYHDEVYHLLFPIDLNGGAIKQTIRQAHSWLFIGAMTSAPREGFFSCSQRSLTLEQLETLARQTKKIIVGAYDGEGYLIWSKR